MTRTILHVLGTARLEALSIAKVALAAATAAPPGTRVLAAFMGGGGPLVDRLSAAGLPSEALVWGGIRNPAGSLRAWRHFRRVAPDIVHQHFGSEYLRGIAKAAGVRRIVAHFHDHGFEVGGRASVPHSTLFADAAIATSRDVAAMVRGSAVPTVIYPCVVPVPADRPPAAEAKGPVIGALSRLAPVKGYIHLIRAMPAVLVRVPQARLEIAGDGEDAASLRAEILRLGLDRSITLLGWQDDLDPLFARWRIFAAPSLMEGFGTALLEAAMRGLPAVASRVGGIPELVRDDVTGFLVPPARPDLLAEALITLLTDTAKATALGKAAAAMARTTFAPQSFVDGVRALYERL